MNDDEAVRGPKPLPDGSRRLARVLEWTCLVLIVAGIVLPFVLLVVVQAEISVGGHGPFATDQMDLGARVAAYIVFILCTALPLYAIHRFRRFVNKCRRQGPFTLDALRHLRGVATTFLIIAFTLPVFEAALQGYITAAHPRTEFEMDLMLGSDTLIGVFLGLAVLFVSHVLVAARELDQEASAFV